MALGINSLDAALQEQLQARRDKQLIRTRCAYTSQDGTSIHVDNRKLINFSSNDYLLLSQHPEVKEAAINSLQCHGVGGNSSALVTGYSSIHEELEQAFCVFTGYDKAFLFSSGYQATQAVIQTLAGGASIYLDKQSHASMIDAARSCTRRWKRYQHCNVSSLDKHLHKSSANNWVLSDGVFSMDGDIAPLAKIAALKDTHTFTSYVDDAHGFGVIGEHGRGTLEYEGVHSKQIDIYMTTFGKALGTNGAVVCTNNDYAEAILQLARPYMYTTALSPMLAAATLKSLQIIQQDKERRLRLQNNIEIFRNIATDKKLTMTNSPTAIQSVITGDADRSVKISAALKKQGFFVPAIREPTVAPGTSRLRISLCSEHRPDHIEALIDQIESCSHQLQ